MITDTDTDGGVYARSRAALARRVGIDTRALAAFRIGLGALLLADLAMRYRDLIAFYTDAGVLPRAALGELFPAFASLSLHAVSGSAWVQRLLFAVAAVFAVALVVGYRSRLAAVGSWLFLVSLHARNPLVLNGGDTVLLVALFVGLFLPLGERYSVDAFGTDRPPRRIVSVASATLLVEVVVVYATNALFKLESDLWMSGVAVRYIFSLDQFTVLLGPTLASVPAVLVAINWAWFGLLAASPLLILLVGRARIVAVAAFVAAHLGMAATMRLGLFPLVMSVALVVFLPPTAWDRIETLVAESSQVAGVFEFLEGYREQLAAAGTPAESKAPAALRRWGRRGVSILVAAVLVSTLVWQAAAVGFVDPPDAVTSTVDPEDHGWQMFAPNPPTADGWYVVPADLESGETVDAFHGGAVDYDRPPDVADAYPTALWHRYLSELRFAGETEHEHFAAYLCRVASDRHDEAVSELDVVYVEQPTRLDGPEPTERIVLHEARCETDTAA